jgi:hypothetical protein
VTLSFGDGGGGHGPFHADAPWKGNEGSCDELLRVHDRRLHPEQAKAIYARRDGQISRPQQLPRMRASDGPENATIKGSQYEKDPSKDLGLAQAKTEPVENCWAQEDDPQTVL